MYRGTKFQHKKKLHWETEPPEKHKLHNTSLILYLGNCPRVMKVYFLLTGPHVAFSFQVPADPIMKNAAITLATILLIILN